MCLEWNVSPVSVNEGVKSQAISPAGGEVLDVDLRVPGRKGNVFYVHKKPAKLWLIRKLEKSWNWTLLQSLTLQSSSGTKAAAHPWRSGSLCCPLSQFWSLGSVTNHNNKAKRQMFELKSSFWSLRELGPYQLKGFSPATTKKKTGSISHLFQKKWMNKKLHKQVRSQSQTFSQDN